MERHGRNLEAEAGKQKDDAENKPGGGCSGFMPCRLRDAGEGHGAGEAINQRRAIEQHARRQRAEDKILQARFGRFQRVAIACRHDVKRQAHQFETEIKRDQIGRRYQHQHAERREQDQNRIFEALLAFALGIIERHRDRGGRADQRQDFQEPGKIVDDKTAAESRELAGRQPNDNAAGNCQQDYRDDIDDPPAGLAAKDAKHQERHGADAENEFRQERNEGRKLRSVHGLPRPHLASDTVWAAVCTALSAC